MNHESHQELDRAIRTYQELRFDRGEFYDGFHEYYKFQEDFKPRIDRLYSHEYLRPEHNPRFTVAIPYSLQKESVGNLVTTIDDIYQQAEKMKGPVEVFVYGNARSPDAASLTKIEADREDIANISQAYEGLKHSIAHYPPDVMRVNTVSDYISDYENFNQIRSRYMNPIIGDVTQRLIDDPDGRNPLDYVVVHLDADSPPLGEVPEVPALEKIVSSLENKEAYVAKGNLVLRGIDKFGNTKGLDRLDEFSPYEKLAVVYSMAKQIVGKNSDPLKYPYYADESGSAFTLRSYLLAGGYGMNHPEYGENRTLLMRMNIAKKAGRLDPNIPTLKYLHDAEIGNDYRRFEHLAQFLPPHLLASSEAGYGYADFSSMEDLSTKRRKISEKNAIELMDMIFKPHEFIIPSEDKNVLRALIKKLDLAS